MVEQLQTSDHGFRVISILFSAASQQNGEKYQVQYISEHRLAISEHRPAINQHRPAISEHRPAINKHRPAIINIHYRNKKNKKELREI